jgi:hypothetical protein
MPRVEFARLGHLDCGWESPRTVLPFDSYIHNECHNAICAQFGCNPVRSPSTRRVQRTSALQLNANARNILPSQSGK